MEFERKSKFYLESDMCYPLKRICGWQPYAGKTGLVVGLFLGDHAWWSHKENSIASSENWDGIPSLWPPLIHLMVLIKWGFWLTQNMYTNKFGVASNKFVGNITLVFFVSEIPKNFDVYKIWINWYIYPLQVSNHKHLYCLYFLFIGNLSGYS